MGLRSTCPLCFPDGETFYEVQGRVVETIERLRIAHPNQTVAIFSHGDVIRTTLLTIWERRSTCSSAAISTASVSAIAFSARGSAFTNYLADMPRLS